MPTTHANEFDTERDLIVPQSVAQSGQVPTTPWSVIESASNQLSAGQPVTALPKQSWSVEEGQDFVARLNQFDQQAKAARDAAQQAAIDARMLDQMSRVAKSTKDIEIARRSIDVMALQRDIQNGVPIHQAIARHPMALGSGLGTALRATTPAPQFNPREVQVGPNKLVETAPNRFSFPPSTASLENQKRVGTEMTTPSGLHAVWVGPNQIRLTEKAESKELTPAQLLDYADSLRFSRSPTDKAKAQAIMDFIGEKAQKQIALSKGSGATGTIHPLPSDKSKRVKGQLYETPKGAAEWTGEGWILRETK